MPGPYYGSLSFHFQASFRVCACRPGFEMLGGGMAIVSMSRAANALDLQLNSYLIDDPGTDLN